MEQEEIRKIVREILTEELDLELARITAGHEDQYNRLALLQHLIRLEEELKAQRELMEERFKAQRELMEQRFKAIDRRFEAVDKRFEAVDKRFEAVDKRFEDLYRYLDARFDATNRRFEAIDRRFTQLTWLITTVFAILATLITVFRFLG